MQMFLSKILILKKSIALIIPMILYYVTSWSLKAYSVQITTKKKKVISIGYSVNLCKQPHPHF